jgi:hypothetical protein
MLRRVRPSRRAAKVLGLAAVFAAGVLFAGAVVTGGWAQDSTTTFTTTETTTEPTTVTATEPATTEVTTATVQQTTTRRITVPNAATTTTASSSDNGTPAWVWVLLAVLAVAVVALVAALLARRGGGHGATVPVENRRRRLDGAVGTWAAQGWAVESQTGDSAVLRRGRDLMLVSVDDVGNVATRPLPSREQPY